jgi:hypothetical protein
MGAGTKPSRPVRDGHALRRADRPQPGPLDPVRAVYLRLRLRPSCIFAAAGGTAGRDLRLGCSTDRTKTKGSASDSKPSAINTWPPSGASAGSHGAFGREAAIRATLELRLEFVDGDALPLVADGEGRVALWAFAGGAAMASIASGLDGLGLVVTGFDDFAVTVKIQDPSELAAALDAIDPDAVHPRLPDDADEALKFGLCLPAAITRDVLAGRTSDAAAVAGACRRPRRLLHLPGLGTGARSP